MQQDRGGGDHHHQDMKPPNQDKRVMKAMQEENQAQAQQHQPQKCPRCESMNTKFCYYNNYSLSQPRYFCKTCRRYWTQGGTLRNVPVGGGCRKGKRARASSSSAADTSRSHASSQQPQQLMTKQQNLTISSPQSVAFSSAAAALRTKDHHHHLSGNLAKTTVPSGISSYYSGSTHGFLSSLAAIQPVNQRPADSFYQHLDQIGVGGGSSNLGGMLQGFNVVPSFGGSSQFYNKSTANLLYPSEDSLINQSCSRPASASSSDWHQNFINNSTTNLAISDAALWSTSTTTTGNTNSNNNTGSSALNPSLWPNHLPGYGPPP